MTAAYDLILHKGTVVTPQGSAETAIAVKDGRIAALGDFAPGQGAEAFDASGLHILPGVIDSHVHFREPGLTHKEDFESGSRAAVLGGVTCVFEMPNSDPPTVDVEGVADKMRRAAGRMACDYAFYIGATIENADDLGALETLPGVAGIKVFMGASTGSLLVADDADLLRVLNSGKRRVMVHAEDEYRLQQRKALALPGRPDTHPVWRDAEAALQATKRIAKLSAQSGRPVHVLHMTTREECAFFSAGKGLATCEVTVNHLSLTAPDCYQRLGTFAQMNPPVRDAAHRDALWQAVRDGLIDVLGSDHAPHTKDEKDRLYPQSPSGMPGVQTLVPVMLTHVAEGRLDLARFIQLTSEGPARVSGLLHKGRLAPGYDADFTIVDLKAKRTITASALGTRIGWTQFEAFEAKGWPVAAILRGNIVMRDGALTTAPRGQPAVFSSG